MKKTTRHDSWLKETNNVINYKSNCITCMEVEWYDLLSVLKPPIPSEVPVKIVHFCALWANICLYTFKANILSDNFKIRTASVIFNVS